jgi:AcrR family transcriptional regulator
VPKLALVQPTNRNPGDNSPPELRWIRAPVQDRSQRTLERILDATELLLDNRPFDKVSVSEIAKEAKASVGSFYARFDGKAALLYALHERYIEESRATTEKALAPEQWAAVTLEELTRQMVSFLLMFHREHQGLRRALVMIQTTDEQVRQRSASLASFVVDCLARLLESRRSEIRRPDITLAADFVHRVVFSLLDQITIYGPNSPTSKPMADEVLVEEMTQICLAYLQQVRTT